MAAGIGVLKAKVLIKIGDGEPIEVGDMDIDLIAKTQPVKRGADLSIKVSPDIDAEAMAASVADRFMRRGR